MTERQNRFFPLAALGDGLLLLCALTGFTGSFLSLYGGVTSGAWDTFRPAQDTALDLCAAQMDFFYALAGLFALLSLAAWSLPRFRWAAVGGSALLLSAVAAVRWQGLAQGAGFAVRRQGLVQGAGLTVRLISAQFAQRVDWGRAFDYDPGLTLSQEAAAVRLFLVFSLALLALILGWGVVRARRWWIVLAFTLPPLLPGLVADLFPDWLPFMALAACWCAMLLADLSKWAAPSGRGRLTLTALACAAALLGAVTLAFPRAGYTRPPWALRAEEALYSAVNRAGDFFSFWEGPFQSTVTYVGSAEEADLTRAGPLNYSGRTVLRVRSDYAGRLYLRGSSLAVYEGGVWKALPEGTYGEYRAGGESGAVPLYFPAMQNRDSPQYTITVNNVGAVGACVYAPYFPIPQVAEDTGALPVEDAYLARRQGQWEHTLTFSDLPRPRTSTWTADGTVNFTTGWNGANFGNYPQFVFGHYLDGPEELKYYLAEFCMNNNVYGAFLGVNDPIETAEQIAALLDRLCEYDQSAEAPPAGADPVMYFLTESRRGYCMHYASAATLMLRSLGIPARYVSGFTVESVPDREVTVPDRAAHAWVEVWAPGFGWYPVEVTPATAFAWDQPGPTGGETFPSAPVAESGEPKPTPTPAPSQAPDAPAQPSGGVGPGGGPAGGSGMTALLPVLKALGIIAGTAALLWLGQYLPKKFRDKRLAGPDRNRAALYAYGCLKRMERWGGQMDPRALELAQKARFSQHTLTREELEELRSLTDRQRERLCLVLSPLPRLAFRYRWGAPSRRETGKNPGNSGENAP